VIRKCPSGYPGLDWYKKTLIFLNRTIFFSKN
jgi:hypothetical protein